ncbi:hypothetical protein F53441_11422 [Fusarium austroafricanum]|uniref:PD-(D/E)XK nuclease-like domain-containing protein n=1 Tax=Fusarium austroafricanum TaxID=2364996 RepID=A0A8H4K632_9HYPO|nr:hypothetical protein F53441_11422 [Fusarium austroafricanum]
MSTSTILAWLDSVISEPQLVDSSYENANRSKRRRLNPPTPDQSESSQMSDSGRGNTSPGKRKAQSDLGTTQTRKSRDIRSEIGLPPSEDSFAGSGRLSPSKQFQLLKLQPGGPDYEDLSQFSTKPKELRDLLRKLDRVMEGFDIISESNRAQVTVASQNYEDEFDWVNTGDHHFSPSRDQLGATPEVEFVLQILDKAASCNTNQHHEDEWNKSVHALILEFAFHMKGQRVKDQLITCSSCINAAILPQYQPRTPGASKKVDFCVHINPKNDRGSSAAAAIKQLINYLPGNVFNFTSFQPLCEQPIALSIETKRPTEGFNVAKLQLGVWQAAHWMFLNTLVETQQQNLKDKQLREQAEAQRLAAIEQQDSQQSPQNTLRLEQPDTLLPASQQQLLDPRFNLPDFIPGIIINGHEWWFTVTTMEESRVKFYEKVALGSTKGTKDIYKLICSLQILRHWVDQTYWPWLQELVLVCE